MKQFKSYFPRSSYPKRLTFKEVYKERYCSYKQANSGGSYVVDFVLTLKKNESGCLAVYYVEDDDTDLTIESISLGIQRYIDYLDKQEVALVGIDIIIENTVVHPVDFKPLRYEIETVKLLHRIFFTHGKHVLTNKFNLDVNLIESTENSIWNLFDELQVRNSFLLPNTLQKVLKLPNRTFLQKEFKYVDSNESVTVELATDFFTERHVNYVYLYSENKPESIKLFLIVEEVLKKLIKDVYDSDFNLASFHIGIRKISKESSYFLNHGIFRDELYWFLKSLILTYNNMKQI